MGGVTTAHQVPAISSVSQSYSPPTPDTPDSVLSTPPQMLITKTLARQHSTPALLGLPPTQPTAKVRTKSNIYIYKNASEYIVKMQFNTFAYHHFSLSIEKGCQTQGRHHHPHHHRHAPHHGCGWHGSRHGRR